MRSKRLLVAFAAVVAAITVTPATADVTPMSGSGYFEIISAAEGQDGIVRAWRNVNGLNGFPYTEPGRKIATGFDMRTHFGEIFA
jgi:hypothetical protein